MSLKAPLLLKQIIEDVKSLKQRGRKTLVVFDLDSTLFDVSPRLDQILLDFAKNPLNRERFPESVVILEKIKTLRTDWGIKNALIRAGLDSHHPDFHEALRKFWRTSFFTNEYLEYDQPYDGAVSYAQALDQAGAEIVYLTGRDVLRMGVGSAAVLRKWKFPLDDKRSRLALKPQAGMDDAQFKSDWFAQIPAGTYDRIWFFENEPKNIHLVRRAHQHVEIVFFESTHAGEAEPPTDLPSIIHYLIETGGTE